MKKMCVSSRSPHLFFGKLFYWRAMSLSLARLDSGQRKSSRWAPWNSCQNFVYPWSAHQKKKKRQILNGFSKYFICQFMNCFYNSPRKKQNWNNRCIGQMNSSLFNKEFVSSFFPVNFKRGSMFCDSRRYTSLKRNVTFKEFTHPVIFSSLSQQQTLLILCSVRVSVVLRHHSDAI